jgi:hypothetical protein
MVLLIIISLPLSLFSPQNLTVVTEPNLVDYNWILDTSFKASRGVWFWQDLAFTYGPLFQWLSSAPFRWLGLPGGAIYTTWNMLPLWCTFLFGYLTLHLLIPEQPPWKRFLLLLLLCVFWAPFDGRTAIDIFLFALFLRGWYAVRCARITPVLMGCSGALLCILAGLYSTDTGLYAIAALFIALSGACWDFRTEPQVFRKYWQAILGFAVLSMALVVTLNAIVSRPLDFSGWRNSLLIVNAYRWFHGFTMSATSTIQLLTTLLVAGAIFLLRRFALPDHKFAVSARTGFLLSAFLFGLLGMQSGLVRSDNYHVRLAVFPMVFLASTILFSFRSRTDWGVSALGTCIAILGSVLLSRPSGPFEWSDILHRVRQVAYASRECPSGNTEFDRACYPLQFAETLRVGASYLQEHCGANDWIVVYPYQNIFGIASRRNVAGGLMHSYHANGPQLSEVDIAGLENAAPLAGLYLPDGELSAAIDGVPNFTRSSAVWFWMFRHYRSEGEIVPGVFGLQRDDSRAGQLLMNSDRLPILPQTFFIRESTTILDLGDPGERITYTDFVKFRLTIRYSLWWRLRKPARLQLEIARADGSHELKPFVVEPNVPSDVWIYPWREEELARYFDSDETRWRTNPRPAVTHLRLWISPIDWISVRPEAIVVHLAEAVRVGLDHAVRVR